MIMRDPSLGGFHSPFDQFLLKQKEKKNVFNDRSLKMEDTSLVIDLKPNDLQ